MYCTKKREHNKQILIRCFVLYTPAPRLVVTAEAREVILVQFANDADGETFGCFCRGFCACAALATVLEEFIKI